MDYKSAYLWEKGSEEEVSRVSLVLQQAIVKKQEVLMACICGSDCNGKHGVMESGYFSEGLTEWFHRELLKICEQKNRETELNIILSREIERLQRDMGKYAKKQNDSSKLYYIVIVLWKKRFWMFVKGEYKGYLLNRRFNRKQISEIEKQMPEGQAASIQGIVQRKVGILLCTNNYLKYMEREAVSEMLCMEEEACTEQRMQKRLQELWQENVRRGENASTGVVYIRT